MGIYKKFDRLQLENEQQKEVIENLREWIKELRSANDEESERSKLWKAAAEAAKEESERRARESNRREDEFRNKIADLKNLLEQEKEKNNKLSEKLSDATTKRNFLLTEAGWLTRRKYNKEFGEHEY